MKIKLVILLSGFFLLTSCTNNSYTTTDPTRASLDYGTEYNAANKAPLIDRIKTSGQVYSTLIQSPDQQLPVELMKNARCVAVIPNLIKAAFILGGKHGEGIVSCRDVFQNWSSPGFVSLTGGSFGWQIGAQSTDLVLFFMDEKSAQSLLEKNVTLGGDISVAAGPLGRTAGLGTNLQLKGIYSYARTEGFFAGISLEGAVISPDERANAIFYDRVVSPRDILFSGGIQQIPVQAQDFMNLLPRKS